MCSWSQKIYHILFSYDICEFLLFTLSIFLDNDFLKQSKKITKSWMDTMGQLLCQLVKYCEWILNTWKIFAQFNTLLDTLVKMNTQSSNTKIDSESKVIQLFPWKATKRMLFKIILCCTLIDISVGFSSNRTHLERSMYIRLTLDYMYIFIF